MKQDKNLIQSRPCTSCYLCNSKGVPLYSDLQDRLFGVYGKWNMLRCPNQECGLIWLDPMPLEEDIGKAYQNYYTHQDVNASNTLGRRLFYLFKEGYTAYKYGYNKNTTAAWKKFIGIVISLHPGLRAEADGSVMYLPPKIDGRLLEVGCGSGKMLKQMQNLGWKVEGIDSDHLGVNNARSKGLQVRLGSLKDQEYNDNCFNAIVMSHVIEHVYNPLELLSECYRILKQDGYLVITTPNSRSLGHRIFKEAFVHLDPPRHLHLFAMPSLQYLIEKGGFRRINAFTTIRGAEWMFIASWFIRRTEKYATGIKRSWIIRMLCWGVQLVEWMILQFIPQAGEEIVLIAKKA
ncbi:MAG: class I SAM-dependent methyltransferase [Nitrospirae bacterium]|nr:class I SAM-dependent methyltransferase [Nitrospirota bacterium]